MALSDERIRALWFASKPTPDGRPASWNFARAIEAEVRKDDDALIQQLVEALENGKKVRQCEGGTKYQPILEDAAINAARARLGRPCA